LTVEVPFPENIPTFQPLPLVDGIWIDLTPILNKFCAKFTTMQTNLQNKSNEQRKSVEEQLNKLIEFSAQRIIKWTVDIDEQQQNHTGYDMILGRDFLYSLGLV